MAAWLEDAARLAPSEGSNQAMEDAAMEEAGTEDAARLVPAREGGDVVQDENVVSINENFEHDNWQLEVQPIPDWVKYGDPSGTVWFYDRKTGDFLVPEHHGITYDGGTGKFLTVPNPPEDREWLLYQDEAGEYHFINTRDPLLSFAYAACNVGNACKWKQLVETVVGEDGHSQTCPLGFRDTENGLEFALHDVGGPSCNWNKVHFKGQAYWIHINDVVFNQMVKSTSSIFREEDCETVETLGAGNAEVRVEALEALEEQLEAGTP